MIIFFPSAESVSACDLDHRKASAPGGRSSRPAHRRTPPHLDPGATSRRPDRNSAARSQLDRGEAWRRPECGSTAPQLQRSRRPQTLRTSFTRAHGISAAGRRRGGSSRPQPSSVVTPDLRGDRSRIALPISLRLSLRGLSRRPQASPVTPRTNSAGPAPEPPESGKKSPPDLGAQLHSPHKPSPDEAAPPRHRRRPHL